MLAVRRLGHQGSGQKQCERQPFHWWLGRRTCTRSFLRFDFYARWAYLGSSEVPPMISAKLVQLIEKHCDRITDRVVRELRRDPCLPHLSQLPESDLRSRCQEILQRLGHWLTESNAEEI